MVLTGTLFTQEQKEKLLAYHDEWMRVGLCTDPVDRKATQKAITALYRTIPWAVPRPKFMWFQSPLEVTQYFVSSGYKLGRAVEVHSLLCELQRDFNALYRDKWGLDSHFFWAELAKSLGDRLQFVLESSIASTIVREMRYKEYWLSSSCHYSQHRVSWLAQALFLRDVLQTGCVPARMSKQLDLWATIAKTAGWIFPFVRGVLCCERPTTQKVDENGEVHCGNGPAIEYRNCFKIWSYHGHKVDEEFIMRPQDQDLNQIRGEPNAEVKRIRIEQYAGKDRFPAEGWRRYLEDIGAKCVDRRRNDIENVEEALFRTKDGEMVLVCTCPSTARVYALEVPNSRKNVDRAQAYLHSRAKMDRFGPPNIIGRS